MSKKKGNHQTKKNGQPQKKWLLPVILLSLLAIAGGIYAISSGRAPAPANDRTVSESANVTAYREKIGLLREQALTEERTAELGNAPAGGKAGHAVLISVCNTEQRASVFTGTGKDVETAWQNADDQVAAFLMDSNFDARWVKADVVFTSEVVDTDELSQQLKKSRDGFFRYGVAFDEKYQLALLEAEMNGAKIYDYDHDCIYFEYLNKYLKKADREQLEKLPETYTLFQTVGWFCDEENAVYELNHEGLEYGRRNVELIDDAYVEDLIFNASEFLMEQVKEDGSFIYGYYPRFDNELDSYNIMRHVSTIWSLICRYRMTESEELAAVIDKTIEYALNSVLYADENTAYLYEEKSDEIKLGGNGVTIIALTEYMDALGGDQYVDICRKLGNGILTMMNQETGEYYHVLNGDFSRKEEYRTVYYDGEATFALCRLYALTGEEQWLNAAKSAVDHFIEADYTQYKDHWVAYSMNEITKYTNEPAYYTFALQNAQKNLKEIYERDTTYHTYLEMLMVSFETYDRMVSEGVQSEYLDEEFELDELLRTIYKRADRMLNGYFYPEYAMYMRAPSKILDTFMVRHDGYRVRIDDVQHNIGGYYLYYKNYDKLVEYGMLECRDK